MSDVLQTAVVVGVFSLLTILVNSWVSRSNKREDWRRQDEVARLLREGTAEQKQLSRDVLIQVEALHPLVNSVLTASKENEAAGIERELAMLAVLPAGEQTSNAIAVAEARRDVLSVELAERARQLAIAEQQVRNESARRGGR